MIETLRPPSPEVSMSDEVMDALADAMRRSDGNWALLHMTFDPTSTEDRAQITALASLCEFFQLRDGHIGARYREDATPITLPEAQDPSEFGY